MNRAGFCHEVADVIPVLGGEPDVTAFVHDRSMRICRRPVRHHEDLRLPGSGIEAPDARVAIARVPDSAIAAHNEIVRVSSGLDLEPLELAGLRVEIRDVVPGLTHEPDLARLVEVWVTGARLLPRHRPLGDRNRRVLGASASASERQYEEQGEDLSHCRLHSVRVSLSPYRPGLASASTALYWALTALRNATNGTSTKH